VADNQVPQFRKSVYLKTGTVVGIALELLVLSIIIGFGFVPGLFGKPIYVYIGLILFILVPLQVAMGLRLIPKLSFTWHRANGYVILFAGLIHATFALSVYFFRVPVRLF
jgi:hypothetical protein